MLAFITVLFFLSASSLHAAAPHAQPLDIWQAAVAWDKKFGSFVKSDAGYRYFASIINADDPVASFNHFEEVSVCRGFSSLRCATCFAMLHDQNIYDDTFSEALQYCHDAEIYQVFVAADSHYKGLGTSSKFQELTHRALHFNNPPKELLTKGALFSTNKCLHKTLLSHKSHIFEAPFAWLQMWVSAHAKLENFLHSTCSQEICEVFVDLNNLFQNNPYVLSNIQKHHFQKYAHILIPALLQGENASRFFQMVQESYSCYGPQKYDFCMFLKTLIPLLPFPFSEVSDDELKQRCTCLVSGLWDVFRFLNADITQAHWSICVAYLRHNHTWVNTAFVQNHLWCMAVFGYQTLPKPEQSLTIFDYYRQNHDPYIFDKHAQLIDDVSQILKKHCTEREEETCKDLCRQWPQKTKEKALTTDYQPTIFCNRSMSLSKLFGTRCCILWRWAKEEQLPVGFLELYRTCSYAEKKALNLNAQRDQQAKTPGMKILKGIKLPRVTEDLSRWTMSMFLERGYR